MFHRIESFRLLNKLKLKIEFAKNLANKHKYSITQFGSAHCSHTGIVCNMFIMCNSLNAHIINVSTMESPISNEWDLD